MSFGYVVFISIKSCSNAVLMLICEDITNHILKYKIIIMYIDIYVCVCVYTHTHTHTQIYVRNYLILL